MRWLAERVVKMTGWQFVGQLPPDPKFIVVGAPHTSNWDFMLFLAAISHWDMHPRYLGKQTLFDGVFGRLFRRWGGIPVDRNRPGGIVEQIKREFDDAKRLILVIAPEGTRRAAPYWKSGFLAIAKATRVPLVPAKINGDARTVTLGQPITETATTAKTMDALRRFFSDSEGIKPGGAGPVRIREEDLDRS